MGVVGLLCQSYSRSDWLKRLVTKMTYYVSSGALNSTLTRPLAGHLCNVESGNKLDPYQGHPKI